MYINKMETAVGTSRRHVGGSKFLPLTKCSRTQRWTWCLVAFFSPLFCLFTRIADAPFFLFQLFIARALYTRRRQRACCTTADVVLFCFVAAAKLPFITSSRSCWSSSFPVQPGPRTAYYFYFVYAILSRTLASTDYYYYYLCVMYIISWIFIIIVHGITSDCSLHVKILQKDSEFLIFNCLVNIFLFLEFADWASPNLTRFAPSTTNNNIEFFFLLIN